MSVAISVQGVGKTFKLPHEKQNSIKSLFVNIFRGKRSYEQQKVLKNISFEIQEGEFFGIVGRNGSGKSTLLKLIAGIYEPNQGTIHVNGKLTPFIELGVGFNPNLTGRENVFLNGALLGFSRKEMNAMYQEIVDFAEIEQFMDQKLKNYSSGMQVRLAFSIAIRAQSDILLIDEVLAVGDSLFQEKCFRYFEQLKKEKRTVVFVSHDRGALEKYCKKGVLIENGKMIVSGEMSKVLEKYDEQNVAGMTVTRNALRDKQTVNNPIKGVAHISTIDILDSQGKKREVFLPKEVITVKFHVNYYDKVVNPIFGITIHNHAITTALLSTNTLIEDVRDTGVYNSGDGVDVQLQITEILSNGVYDLTPAVANSNGNIIFHSFDRGGSFEVISSNNPYSLLTLQESLKIK